MNIVKQHRQMLCNKSHVFLGSEQYYLCRAFGNINIAWSENKTSILEVWHARFCNSPLQFAAVSYFFLTFWLGFSEVCTLFFKLSGQSCFFFSLFQPPFLLLDLSFGSWWNKKSWSLHLKENSL